MRLQTTVAIAQFAFDDTRRLMNELSKYAENGLLPRSNIHIYKSLSRPTMTTLQFAMNWSGLTVVITGGGGFVGQRLAERLQHEGCADIRCTDVAFPGDGGGDGDVQRILVDITKPEVGRFLSFCPCPVYLHNPRT
jgi:hypothetical protein